jgi:hypothetical protein
MVRPEQIHYFFITPDQREQGPNYRPVHHSIQHYVQNIIDPICF